MTRGHDQPERVIGERRRGEVVGPGRGVAGVPLGEHEVELPRPQLRDRDLRLELARLDPQPRMGVRQGLHECGHIGRHRALEGRDPHRAGQRGQRRGDVGLGLVDDPQDALDVTDEHLRLRRQPHPATIGLEERDTHLTLELRELLGDRGRTVGQRLRDLGQGPTMTQLTQDTQPPQIVHRPHHSLGLSMSISHKHSLDHRVP